MEYYLISLIITIIIFGIIQIIEYRKISEENEYSKYPHESYSFFSINNILIFIIIYIVITIASYLLYSSNLDISSYFNFKTKGGNNLDNNYSIKEEINPQVISKINDNFDIGLDPFNSENSSISSDNSSDEISSVLNSDIDD